MRPTFAVVFLTLFGWTALQADVTLRFKTELKLNPGLPEQIVGPARKAMAATLPPESSLRLRNGKGFSDDGFPFVVIASARNARLAAATTRSRSCCPA